MYNALTNQIQYLSEKMVSTNNIYQYRLLFDRFIRASSALEKVRLEIDKAEERLNGDVPF